MNSCDGKKIVQNLHTLAYNYGLFIKGLFLVEVIPCKLFHQKKNSFSEKKFNFVANEFAIRAVTIKDIFRRKSCDTEGFERNFKLKILNMRECF